MAHREVIVIGASAGGVEAVLALARALPAGLPAAIFVVIHTSPSAPGFLSGLIDRAGPLAAAYATDGAVAQPGRIYVAPADEHLILEPGGVMRLLHGPRENGFRPGIDPLFRSAARVYGPRAIGVILSGYLDDGTLGLLILKRQGGVAIVQDPETAACPAMPRSAIATVPVDYVVSVGQMPSLFTRLVSDPLGPLPPEKTMPAQDRHGTSADATSTILRKQQSEGAPTALTCPECGGAIWEKRDVGVLQYSCHVGHVYTGEVLQDQYAHEVEAALWAAMRHLAENAELHRRLARRMRDEGPKDRADDHQRRAEESDRRAAIIRELLVNGRFGAPAEERTLSEL